MKINIVVLMLATIASLSVTCQPIKIPAVVKTAFSTKFPNAANVKWGKENAKEYEAEFKMNDQSVSTNFGTNGNWVETETTIPVSDLPSSVSGTIHTKYPGALITKAEKLEKPMDKIFYEVLIKVNGKTKEIELNPDGSFVK